MKVRVILPLLLSGSLVTRIRHLNLTVTQECVGISDRSSRREAGEEADGQATGVRATVGRQPSLYPASRILLPLMPLLISSRPVAHNGIKEERSSVSIRLGFQFINYDS